SSAAKSAESTAKSVSGTAVPTAVPRLLTPALVAAVVSAAALTAAGVHGVVQEAPDAGGPAFTSWPLLTVLAVLPAAVAALLVYRGRSATAAGVLIGVAALAPRSEERRVGKARRPRRSGSCG